jgi:hypothetical protein
MSKDLLFSVTPIDFDQLSAFQKILRKLKNFDSRRSKLLSFLLTLSASLLTLRTRKPEFFQDIRLGTVSIKGAEPYSLSVLIFPRREKVHFRFRFENKKSIYDFFGFSGVPAFLIQLQSFSLNNLNK